MITAVAVKTGFEDKEMASPINRNNAVQAAM
jgi:hypothetical protein